MLKKGYFIIPQRSKQNYKTQLSNRQDSLSSFSFQLQQMILARLPKINTHKQKPHRSIQKINSTIRQIHNSIKTLTKEKTGRTSPLYYYPPLQFTNQLYQCSNLCRKIRNTAQIYQNSDFQKKEKQIDRQKQHKFIQNNLKERNVKKKKKKFKIYVLVILFTLWFPKFSKIFTIVRYKMFQLKYLKDNGGIIKRQTNQMKKYFENVEIGTILDWIDQKYLEQINQNKNKNLMGEMLIDILTAYLSQIYPKVKDNNFIRKFYNTLSIGTINNGFLTDYVLTLDQLRQLRFHREKGYIIVNDDFSAILLMNLLFVKILISNILLPFSENEIGPSEDISDRQQKIHLVGALLYVLCRDLYRQSVKMIQYNENCPNYCIYQQLDPQLRVKPASPIIIRGKNKKKKNEHIIGISNLKLIQTFLKDNGYLKPSLLKLKSKLKYFMGEIIVLIKQKTKQLYDEIKQNGNLYNKNGQGTKLKNKTIKNEGRNTRQI